MNNDVTALAADQSADQEADRESAREYERATGRRTDGPVSLAEAPSVVPRGTDEASGPRGRQRANQPLSGAVLNDGYSFTTVKGPKPGRERCIVCAGPVLRPREQHPCEAQGQEPQRVVRNGMLVPTSAVTGVTDPGRCISPSCPRLADPSAGHAADCVPGRLRLHTVPVNPREVTADDRPRPDWRGKCRCNGCELMRIGERKRGQQPDVCPEPDCRREYNRRRKAAERDRAREAQVQDAAAWIARNPTFDDKALAAESGIPRARFREARKSVSHHKP